MVEMTHRLRNNAQPVPAPTLLKAFNDFFKVKSNPLTRNKIPPVNRFQARAAAITFQYLQSLQQSGGTKFEVKDMTTALTALFHRPKDEPDWHFKLSKMLFDEIATRKEGDTTIGETQDAVIHPYLTVLCYSGNTNEAMAVLSEYSKLNPPTSAQGNKLKKIARLWVVVLDGFATEGNESEVLSFFELMKKSGLVYSHHVHLSMTRFFARRDNIEATKYWYNQPLSGSGDAGTPLAETNLEVIKFCLRNNEMEWGQNIFLKILESNPDKPTWDVIFQWAVAMQKGVDEIERMFEVMVRRNKDNDVRPDIDTINALIAFAISQSDPYTAERFLALGYKWQMLPNAKTFILQMDYRLTAKDLDGAYKAYEGLQGEDVLENEDLPVTFRLLRALCESGKSERINVVYGEITERKARMDAETVSALCTYHLERGHSEDIFDLMQQTSFHLTVDERAKVRDVFAAFVLDESNSTARAWDAYQIIRQIFDETSVPIRTQLMNEFFKRDRSDMACHAFGHMRSHLIMRPTSDTYVACFEGIADVADHQGLEMVHNMLKLDFEIEPSTRIYNALMLAYSSCDMPYRAYEYWEDVSHSSEGPSYNSIAIALEACRKLPYGDEKAREIWQKLRREADTNPSREAVLAYASTLLGHGHADEAIKAVESVEMDVDREL
jgi:pentatricopeptide repeat protein